VISENFKREGMPALKSFSELSNATRPFPNNTAMKDWKPVYVYRGGNFEAPKDEWLGQVHQDKLIAWLTKNLTGGYFVDLASNDALDLSNTYMLERNLNWSGLCIEANPQYWHGLGTFRSCTVLGAVVGKTSNEKITFRMNDAHGGIIGNQFDNKDEKNTEHKLDLYTAQLEEAFGTFNVPPVIDYLSLDVEGAEEYIMSAFPFDRYRFRFMTVERPSASFDRIMNEHGYRYVKKLVYFGDTLYAHESELPIDKDVIIRYCRNPKGGRKYQLQKRADRECPK
jgi:hypothetical protein